MIKPEYVNEKGTGIGASFNEFRGTNYVHISMLELDPDENYWYRVKGLSITEDFLDPLIEKLLIISDELGKKNLENPNQLVFNYERK